MMRNQTFLSNHLVELLESGQAHITFDGAVKNWPAGLRGIRPKGAAHSPWEVLEHMRIAQWDIREFTRNPKHVSPNFPDGYWPKTPAPPSAKAWSKSMQSFRADLRAMIKLVQNKNTDLAAPLPHGTGQTVLREALLVADHNAYHLGELLLLGRLLGVRK